MGNFEIGQKPVSNPKTEISNWTVQPEISDFGFEMGFCPISDCLTSWPRT